MMGAIGTDEWGVARLHARIAELEAEIVKLHAMGGAPIFTTAMGKRAVQAEAALAQRDRESTDLLDAIFQTIDPEDGEKIVAEAFPRGGPAWVLAWYREHPNEEELRARVEEGSRDE